MISVGAVIQAVILLICLGLVAWLLHWLIGYVNPPEPFHKVARVVLAVACVLVCIVVLLNLAGIAVVRW
jgi:Kef-type K+ transport system membrane component KefB